MKKRLIREFNEFTNSTSQHVVDKQLSINAFDRHEDSIRQSMARIGDIMNDIRGSKSYSKLRSKLALEEQDIKSLKILRIVKSHIDYTVYISFIIDDIEYWGNIENINTDNPILKSEVFKDYDLYQPKEWIVKTSGIIIETIKRWLKPESGIYKLLNDNKILGKR